MTTKHLCIPLVLSLAALCAYAERVPVQEKVRTAGGTVLVSSSHTVTPKSLGVPLCRGAEIVKGSEYVVKTDQGELALARVQATLRTKAPRADVEQFYRKVLRGTDSTTKSADGNTLLWKTEAGKVWILTITGKAGERTTIEVRHAARHKAVAAEFPRRERRSPTRPGLPQSI